MSDIIEDVDKLTSWCLDKAYKKAVHNRGLTDWSTASEQAKKEIFQDQFKIAQMMLNYLAIRQCFFKPNKKVKKN